MLPLKNVEDAACLLFTVLSVSSQHVFANFPLLTKHLACKLRSSLRNTFRTLKTDSNKSCSF